MPSPRGSEAPCRNEAGFRCPWHGSFSCWWRENWGTGAWFFSRAGDRNDRAGAKEDLLVLTVRPGVSWCSLKAGECKQGVLPAAQLLRDNHTSESVLVEQSCGVPVQGNVRGARNKSAWEMPLPFLQSWRENNLSNTKGIFNTFSKYLSPFLSSTYATQENKKRKFGVKTPQRAHKVQWYTLCHG